MIVHSISYSLRYDINILLVEKRCYLYSNYVYINILFWLSLKCDMMYFGYNNSTCIYVIILWCINAHPSIDALIVYADIMIHTSITIKVTYWEPFSFCNIAVYLEGYIEIVWQMHWISHYINLWNSLLSN